MPTRVYRVQYIQYQDPHFINSHFLLASIQELIHEAKSRDNYDGFLDIVVNKEVTYPTNFPTELKDGELHWAIYGYYNLPNCATELDIYLNAKTNLKLHEFCMADNHKMCMFANHQLCQEDEFNCECPCHV